jgi:hypothetical protein
MADNTRKQAVALIRHLQFGAKKERLDALLRRASRIAEQQFNKKRGTLDPFLLVEMADGKQEIIDCRTQGKDALADPRVRRYVVAIKGWIRDKLTPADVSEAIVLIAEGGDDACSSFRDIIRTSNGALLGELAPIDRPTHAEAPFFGFRNVR